MPKERLTERLVLLISKTMKRRLRERAKAEERSVGELVREAIDRYLEKKP